MSLVSKLKSRIQPKNLLQNLAETHQGCIDQKGNFQISGWAWKTKSPTTPIKLSIYQDDELLGSTVADVFRKDLLDARIGDGKHGFVFKIPEEAHAKAPSKIHIRYEETGEELPGSPYSLYKTNRFSSIPWTESPFFKSELEKKAKTKRQQEDALFFNENGFLTMSGVVSDELMDQAIEEAEPLFNPDVKVGAQSFYRFQDAWKISPAVRKLAIDPKIVETLQFLYDRTPVPFQTLNFKYGSQQRAHSDSIHFSCFPERFMCGVWLALEDITEENGPLFYYPGSHKLPQYHMYDMGLTVEDPNYKKYEDFIANLMESHGLEKKALLVKKGDLLVWSSNLVHGGSAINNESLTRWSQVTHYYFNDCIYYTPMYSDPIAGEYYLRTPVNLSTNQPETPTYNGRPFEKTEVAKDRYTIKFQ